MSTLDIAVGLLRQMNEAQLTRMIGLMYIEKQREEAADDAYCAALAAQYDARPTAEKDDFISLDDALKEAGLTRDDLLN